MKTLVFPFPHWRRHGVVYWNMIVSHFIVQIALQVLRSSDFSFYDFIRKTATKAREHNAIRQYQDYVVDRVVSIQSFLLSLAQIQILDCKIKKYIQKKITLVSVCHARSALGPPPLLELCCPRPLVAPH